MKDSNPVNGQLARFVFAGVAIFIFGWTASLTYTFVGAALPDMPWYVPLLALVVFDVGLIAWLFVFLHLAKGIQQRSIALVTTIFDLLGVGLMVLAEILLGGQTWATAPESIGEYAIWGIATWTIGNLAAVVAFHLSSPEARQQMAIQNVSDEIFEETLQELRNLSTENRNAMAQHMSKTMFADLEAKLASVLGEDYTKSRLQSPPQIPTEAPTNGASPNMRQLGFDAPGAAQSAPQGQQRSDLPLAGNGRAPGNERPKASSRPVVQSQPVSSIEGHTQSGRPIRSQPEPVNKERLWSNGSNTIYRESYCPSCRQHVAAGHVRNLSCSHCGVWIREATELEVLREGNSRRGVVLDQRLYRTGAWLPEKPTATHTNDGAPLSLDGLDLEEPGK